MARLRRAIWRRLAYGPRFLKHYRHRRQYGYLRPLAFRSPRQRMRDYVRRTSTVDLKLLVLYRPPEDAVALEDHFANWHLPLAAKMPFVQRFEVGRVLGTPDGYEAPYYRVDEFWFQSEEALHQALRTDEGRAAVADLPRLLRR